VKHAYDTKTPIVSNGPRRYGQFEWHNESCEVQMLGISREDDGKPLRMIWCVTHGQWAHEVPVSVTWEFRDGEKIVRKL